MDLKTWSKEAVQIRGPDDLRESLRGSDIENVQLMPGKLQGSIARLGAGNLGISMGRFNSGIRIRGTPHQERVVLSIILDSSDRITQWWKDVQPGDVGVFSAGVEFDAIHCGGTVFLSVSISLPELSSMLGGEDRLADPAFRNKKGLYRPNPRTGDAIRQRLKGIMSDVERKTTAPSAQAVDFLQRSIIEAFVVSLTSAALPDRERSLYTGARLVSEAEDYVDAASGRPVHISELCSALKLSRRSLHRAFADTLGIGPVAYLRRRRLSAIQSALKLEAVQSGNDLYRRPGLRVRFSGTWTICRLLSSPLW
jgi:AraC family ethanolamine operon transcriptional activator